MPIDWHFEGYRFPSQKEIDKDVRHQLGEAIQERLAKTKYENWIVASIKYPGLISSPLKEKLISKGFNLDITESLYHFGLYYYMITFDVRNFKGGSIEI